MGAYQFWENIGTYSCPLGARGCRPRVKLHSKRVEKTWKYTRNEWKKTRYEWERFKNYTRNECVFSQVVMQSYLQPGMSIMRLSIFWKFGFLTARISVGKYTSSTRPKFTLETSEEDGKTTLETGVEDHSFKEDLYVLDHFIWIVLFISKFETSGELVKSHSKQVDNLWNHTRNEWGTCETALETSGELVLF